MAISEQQTKLAAALLERQKTAEELAKELKLPISDISDILKEMLKLGLLKKAEGFPVKYGLIEAVAQKVKERKAIEDEDSNKLRLRIMIEGKAIELELLKKQMKEMETALKAEKGFRLYDIQLAKAIKQGEHYSSYLEINLSVKGFRELMKLLFFYGPASLEVVKPSKLELSADELQDGLVDAAIMIHAYNNYIAKMMSRAEVAEFHKKLFKGK